MINVKQQLVTSREKTYDGENPATSISIHETDNYDIGADAQAHADLQSSGNVRQASWHYQVDDKQVIQSFTHDVQCWHAGDDEGNKTSIAVEMCVNADGNFSKTIINTVTLVVQLMRELNLTTEDIKDHHYWSGKNCPSTLRNEGKWAAFLRAVDGGSIPNYGGSTMAKWSSPLPRGCRFTSGFGTRWGTLHAGADFGPPKPGQTGVAIYALHDGKILATGYGRGAAGDRIPYHSGRYIWQDIGVHGGDKMRIYYGHLARSIVKAGQSVKAGQIIGYMGGSGRNGENHFAIHLHLGVSVNHNRPTARWNSRNNTGWIDPVPWLRSKGITVGSTRPVTTAGTSSKSSASAKKSSASSSQYTQRRTNQNDVPVYANRGKDKRKVGTASTKGYRMNVVKTDGSWAQVRWKYDGKYQNAWVASAHLEGGSSSSSAAGIEWPANKLREDGDWGAVSRRAYQRLLKPESVGNYTGRIDGQIGSMTVKAEQRWLAGRGHYKGRIDGQRGPMTIRALQNRLRADGFYKGRIDGKFQRLSIIGLQKLMNSQQNLYK